MSKTVADVAAMLNISRQWVHKKYVETGELIPIMVVGGTFVFDDAEVKAVVAKRRKECRAARKRGDVRWNVCKEG